MFKSMDSNLKTMILIICNHKNKWWITARLLHKILDLIDTIWILNKIIYNSAIILTFKTNFKGVRNKIKIGNNTKINNRETYKVITT